MESAGKREETPFFQEHTPIESPFGKSLHNDDTIEDVGTLFDIPKVATTPGKKKGKRCRPESPAPTHMHTPSPAKHSLSVNFTEDLASISPAESKREASKVYTRSMALAHRNGLVPTPAMDFAKDIQQLGWLDDKTFDKENFKKAHAHWSRASGHRENEEAKRKFRILDYIDDELVEKIELRPEELRDVLAFVDRIEGPLFLEMMAGKAGSPARDSEQADTMSSIQRQVDKQCREPLTKKQRKRLKQLENEKRGLGRELGEERLDRSKRDKEYQKAYEIEKAKAQIEFDREVRLMAERAFAEKAAKATKENATDIDS